MNQISPFPIWVGHATEGQNFALIHDEGIEAVIELAAEEPAFATPRDLISCRFPLLDGPDNRPEILALAIATVARLARDGVRTLVCCGSGMSRSPAIIAAALALIHQEAPGDWLVRVTHHHPTDVSPGLWNEVVRLSLTAFNISGSAPG